MSDASVGSGSEGFEACSDVGAESGGGDGFVCPYCENVYASEEERSVCQASHFEGSGSIPRKARSDRKAKSIVKDWKKEASE